MSNPHRAECSLQLGEQRYVLRLSLQALAEIEAAFAVSGLHALGLRLSEGAIGTADLVTIAAALVRGGGTAISDRAFAENIEAQDLPEIIRAISRVFAASFPEGAEGGVNPR